MRFKRWRFGWWTKVPLAKGPSHGASVDAWTCTVVLIRGEGCWLAARATAPVSALDSAPGYYSGIHPFRRIRRIGYGRTREDAVHALRVACWNGWESAGDFARRDR